MKFYLVLLIYWLVKFYLAAGKDPDIGIIAADELTSFYYAKLNGLSLLVLKC